ncbi:LacI family DNA-binding transcriptional regulator [Neobacillus sp. D3-1R]|uniref:LacI family DNA-binding transcriptional regulator n=1 Tax=Neobacillus sp. D3-1R TaxID=3445778 RepID=UPI003FA128FF
MATITIKEIAKLAGVSTATVSRVLNNSGGYSDETKQRVLEILDKFNYQMNVVAKSLRTSLTNTIGIIVPDITNEYYALIALAIEKYCAPRGYSIYIYNTDEDPEKEKLLIRDLESRGVDGLIYISGKMSVPQEALKKRLPIVCVNRREEMSQEITVIESDNYQGGFIATEELLNKGCKSIIIIRDERDIVPMNERYRGYCDALKKRGLSLNLELIQPIPFNVSKADECVQNLIRNQIHFDGIFACSDMLAFGAMQALREHGKRIPEDIKVVGFDNITFGKYSFPELTTIHQDKVGLGEKASEILLNIIEKKERPKQSIMVLPVELVKRKST